MAEYSRTVRVQTSADKAFAFASDVENLPRYVPTTRHVEESGPGKIHVEGEAQGEAYSDDGHIYVDPERRLMRWGSGETGYRGELSVSEAGDGSDVSITLHFNDSDGRAPDPDLIEKDLGKSLERLKSELAG